MIIALGWFGGYVIGLEAPILGIYDDELYTYTSNYLWLLWGDVAHMGRICYQRYTVGRNNIENLR